MSLYETTTGVISHQTDRMDENMVVLISEFVGSGDGY